jgi:predicted ATPase
MRAAVSAHDGTEVNTEGDSFFVVFDDPGAALRTAVEAQRSLAAAAWPGDDAVTVRMGLHAGAVTFSDGEYLGVELHRAARISSVAHGGQVVISEALQRSLGGTLPAGASLRNLGEHRLKDFDEPVTLFQVDIEGLRTEFPPLTSLSARFDILPPELSTFVGREDEIGRISELLASSRLLTMTGPGGTGKTRLALRVARHCGESYPQGVAFVQLAPITDPNLVAPTIRGALGFAEEPGRRSVDTLTERLKSHELLLILDNFEQVMPASEAISRLLEGTEHLTVMVTSRAVLHLDGEQEFSVPPMAVPEPGETPDIEELAANESVRLFVERARLARPGFKLAAGNARSVALICKRLEGLPLAIELAAARTKLLSPDALLTRLSSRLDLLSSRGAGSGDRRRTLRGTIDWSHDLLDPQEQVAFRRLAIFTGGATLEAIEALLPAIQTDESPAIDDVLEPMSSLVDHSLLRPVETSSGSRYVMLETIREYGLERLAAAGEATALSDAHAERFLGRMKELSSGFTAGPEGLDEVEADHDNVRAALRWIMEQDRTEDSLSAVAALWRFWHLRGHLREGLGVCEEVIALPGADSASEAAAGALYAHASLKYWQGDTAQAKAGYLRSREVARKSGAKAREAEAEFALSYAHAIFREFDEGHRAAQTALRLYQELGDDLGTANAQFADAYLWSLAGNWERAETELVKAIAAIEAIGDRFWMLNSRVVLAWTLTRMDRVDEARAILLANLDMAIELGDRSTENMAIQGLSTVAALGGDMDRALRLAGAAEAIADDLGGKAPTELIIGLDPETLARERGMPDERAAELIAEGRGLRVEASRELARGVATID